MKILIVDDEELTRTGVIASVEWEKLGITEIYQADDGVNGLKLARQHRPEIILCDVRMPRMDGITMLETLEKEFSDIVVIFMSGYSDKEYLKAAIQLKAIDYIEKPIEQKELRTVVKKAVERCSVIRLQAKADETHESKTLSELAYRFTLPYRSNADEVDALCENISEHYSFGEIKYVTTYIVKIKEVPENPDAISDVYSALAGYLKIMNMKIIYTEKKSHNIIFHIFATLCPQPDTLKRIAMQLGELMKLLGEYYIAIGETVNGKENVYKSYSSAVILLQNSFFRNPGEILLAGGEEKQDSIGIENVRGLASDYEDAISDYDKAKVYEAVEGLAELKKLQSTMLLENQIKSVYYELLLALFKARRSRGLALDMTLENQETIMDMVEECFCFEQLHGIFSEKTEDFFADTEGEVTGNPTIRLICEYIADHYSSLDLSVKSISDHAAMSTSYACTYFKNETGMTINQYITDFRMKKAKQLLVDPRNKVNEISMAVGYSDGNYFAKSFRKYTGLSPSEYREQVIRS